MSKIIDQYILMQTNKHAALVVKNKEERSKDKIKFMIHYKLIKSYYVMEISCLRYIEVTNEPHIWAIDLFQCKKWDLWFPEY
jgi:hypothetical protein